MAVKGKSTVTILSECEVCSQPFQKLGKWHRFCPDHMVATCVITGRKFKPPVNGQASRCCPKTHLHRVFTWMIMDPKLYTHVTDDLHAFNPKVLNLAMGYVRSGKSHVIGGAVHKVFERRALQIDSDKSQRTMFVTTDQILLHVWFNYIESVINKECDDSKRLVELESLLKNVSGENARKVSEQIELLKENATNVNLDAVRPACFPREASRTGKGAWYSADPIPGIPL